MSGSFKKMTRLCENNFDNYRKRFVKVVIFAPLNELLTVSPFENQVLQQKERKKKKEKGKDKRTTKQPQEETKERERKRTEEKFMTQRKIQKQAEIRQSGDGERKEAQ